MTNLTDTTGTWQIDPTHTTIGFSVRHAMIAKVRGRFTDFAGTFTLNGDDPANSSAQLTVLLTSVDTQNDDRDNHLRSAEFFDVESFPEMTFVSTGVEAKGSDFVVTGDLSVHGVTKSVPVKFELVGISQDPWGNTRIGFEGEADINRRDFGLEWNVALDTGGVLVSENIKITLDVEAVKQA
ncbi:MAG: YceI family protein [Candidatus Nanopelagicales bacterium]|jgi:polyisoprenoid-binding protein YceI|nr:YceI family protein [Candidatus Nanopelagicales bacterium]